MKHASPTELFRDLLDRRPMVAECGNASNIGFVEGALNLRGADAFSQ